MASAKGASTSPPSAKSGAERHRDEPDARGGVDEREQAAERGGGEQRAAEDVLGLLSARLPRRGAREENGEDRRRQEEADAREGRRGRVAPASSPENRALTMRMSTFVSSAMPTRPTATGQR